MIDEGTPKPPAARARRAALILSAIAVVFSLPCGYCFRQAYALRQVDENRALEWILVFLVSLLIAMVLRIAASLCELFWLVRTWSNLPDGLRKVGPLDDVNNAMVVAISFMPGIAWIWKLGLVRTVCRGFEHMRGTFPFGAPIPRGLGTVAVMCGWVPGVNVYLAPFLWEMFATRIDRVVNELQSLRAATMPASPT